METIGGIVSPERTLVRNQELVIKNIAKCDLKRHR